MSTPAADPVVTPDPFTPIAFAVADATGKIVLTGLVPPKMIAYQVIPAGGSLVEGVASIAADYILNGVITPRPVNPTTLTGLKLLNVPNPSTVTIAADGAVQVTDGEVDMSFTQPGTYNIKVVSWPFLDGNFSVTQ